MASKVPPNTTIQIILAIAVGIFVIYSVALINEKLFGETGAAVLKAAPPAEPVVSQPDTEYVSNEILIKVKDNVKNKIKQNNNPFDTGIASLDDLNKKNKVKKFEKIAKPGKNSDQDSELFKWYKITLDEPQEIIKEKDETKNQKVKRAVSQYQNNPDIEAAEPNYIMHAFLVPNDPYYSSTGSWGQTYPDMWGMQKINAAAAWDQTTGSNSVVVAVVDTGVDRNHPDLAANMWTNPGEIPNNGIDDDGNGYIDDYYGWDFVNNDNDPMDDYGHGTHCAGTIGAVGNNGIGVVGVNWNVKIMALKFLDASGGGTDEAGIKALQYAADMGARVSSNSWGGGGSVAMEDAVKYEHDRGMVIVAAAGNANSDALGFCPAYADYAIAVAASNHNDAKACFSNWGEKIDVAAPGGDSSSCGGIDDHILSTRASINKMCGNSLSDYYCIARGTSMATPHVSGLAALLLAKNPALTNEEIRQILRMGADDLGTVGKDSSFGYGRINAAGSMALANTKPLAPIITSPKSRTMANGLNIQILGSVPGSNFASYKLEYGSGRTPSSWTTIASSNSQVINGVLGNFDTTQFTDGLYTIRLTATDTGGKTYQFQIFDYTVDNFDVALSWPRVLIAPGIINVTGTATTKNGMAFSNYKLEWTKNGTWYTTGIKLANGGNQPVANGLLGTWDTTGINDLYYYSLRLTVATPIGVTASATNQMLIDSNLVPGWPKAIHRNSNCYYDVCQAAPTVADLDGDGTKEIVVTSPDNKIYAFRKDGSSFPGFPIAVSDAGTDEYFYWPANVVDLDGDGKKEIVAVAVTPNYVPCGNCNRLYVFRSDGSPYPGWIPQTFLALEYMPAAGDLDGDGKKEIILTDPYYRKIYAFHADGTQATGFPTVLPTPQISTMGSTPAIFDIDNDGKKEFTHQFGDTIYLFNSDGTLRWKYTAPLNSINQSAFFAASPSVGDINGDGNLEIVALDYTTIKDVGARLFVLTKDGALLPNWPVTTMGVNYFDLPQLTPSLADIDNDGKDEIILGLWYPQILDENGVVFTNKEVPAQNNPALADVDGDGKIEFTAIQGNSVAIVNSEGTKYWLRVLPAEPALIKGDPLGRHFMSPGIFSDLDNDGTMEFILGEDKGFYLNDPLLYMWEVPKVSNNPAQYEWPMFSHDPARTGRLIVSPQPPDTIAPSVAITYPSNSTVLAGTVTVTATATDNVGVTKVEFYVDSALKFTDTISPYAFYWNTTVLPNGNHTLSALAYDEAGHVGSSGDIIVLIYNSDVLAPSVNITYPTEGATVSGNVSVTAVASDNIGVTKVEFSLDSIIKFTDTISPYIYVWDTKTSSEGNHTIRAAAYDATDNMGVSLVKVIVSNSDKTAPSVGITSPAQDAVVTGTINVNAIASDNVGVTKVEFYVDDLLKFTDTTSPYIYTWNTTTSVNGNHTLSALAYDAATNVGISSDVSVIVSNGGLPSSQSGNITGTVTSSLGGVLSGVKVTTNIPGSKKSMSSTTNSAGIYKFTNLPPGTYILKFQAKGFVAQSATVSVVAGATATKNVVMLKR